MEAAHVQRFVLLVLAVVCGSALLAATPAPSILGTPVLIVYPFSVNGGDVSKEAGSRLAVTIASQIADLGGVDVRPAPAGIDRQKYLDAAHHEGADYYITGFVTPLGDGVSVVEQLVSTQTGIVVYSNTAQVRTYADAASQGDVLRDALLRHQTRNLGAYAAPPPPVNTPTPQATSGAAAQANLGRLFGHKQRTAATPTAAAPAAVAIATAAPSPARTSAPSPVPTAQTVAALPPGPDYGVLTIGGTAADELRAFTGAAIRNDIVASHRRAAQLAGTPQTACRADSIGTLLGGNLSTRNHTILGEAQTIATFELLAYDCAGNVVYRKTFARDARGDWKTAVNLVVANAVTQFLRK